MENIIQKSVELGVHKIVPVFTSRTVVAKKENFAGKISRWQKAADEAVKQCRRGIIPKVLPDITFPAMINEISGSKFDCVIFPYENEENCTIKEVLRGLCEKPASVALIIGPEGGFSDEEAGTLVGAGAKAASLGKTILRTETAAPAALAMVMYELEL
jgi:16S rRNA (uracil1498-N3)-methyltransferase